MAESDMLAPSPVKVIGVIDLRGGRAVHARGGTRAAYQPVAEAAGTVIDGDAVSLIRAYAERGVREVYVADLDAIVEGAPQEALLARLVAAGLPIWVDAGVTSAAETRRLLALGIARVVVGLETLPSFEALAEMCTAAGPGRMAFSLDLKGGIPLVRPGVAAGDRSPHDVARRAAAAGADTLIVLDLARVGSGAGPDLPLLRRVRAAVPGVVLLAGGGVRDEADLARLAGAGCNGALVGTALLSGRLVLPTGGVRPA